jgi:hypothetical protein
MGMDGGSVPLKVADRSYDVFLSYHRENVAIARPLRDALCGEGLEVFFDEREIEDFRSITERLAEGLSRSKALLAVYSTTYPTRRACQFELTAAFLAAQRVGAARARVLVVNPEEGVEHIEPGELRDALFRRLRATDPPQVVAAVAASVTRHVAGLEGVLGDFRPLAGVAWHGRHPVSSPWFVGRIPAMWELHSKLHAGELRAMTGVPGPAAVQLRGLGGIGKTMLAEEYALRFAPAYPGGVFWLTAPGGSAAAHFASANVRSAERARQVRSLAADVGVPVEGLTDPADVEAALQRELERRSEAHLWVVDDLPDGLDADELRGWFAPHRLGKTLLTTRSRRYGALAAIVEPGLLTPRDAGELLARHRPPLGKAGEAELERLAEDLGFHALALEVAGAALSAAAGPAPYTDFRAALAEPVEDELEFAAELADALPSGHRPSIAATLLSSVADLGEEAIDLLRLASLLANTPIPASLVDSVFADVDALEQREARHRGMRARRETERASLVDQSGEELTIHPLVSRTMRFADRETPARPERLRCSTVNLLVEQLRTQLAAGPSGDVELLMPHARQLSVTGGLAELELRTQVASYDYQRGAFVSARELQEQVLDGRWALVGEGHPDTLAAMNNLAGTLGALGELERARELEQQVLDGLRELLGEGHPDTLWAMGNLAPTLRALGELDQARELEQQVLDRRRALLGDEHPSTLIAMNNLAETLRAQGELAAARELGHRVLDGHRELLGEGHPDTLAAMGNLAGTLGALGELERARELEQQVLDGRRTLLGEGHPDTLAAMGGLAWTLGALGELERARELQEHVLDGLGELLGEGHPDTLAAMYNLAGTLGGLGELDQARELEQQVLDGLRELLGEAHPDTLTAMGNLAGTLGALGELDQARELEQRVAELG